MASTHSNKFSSRSHAIIQISIERYQWTNGKESMILYPLGKNLIVENERKTPKSDTEGWFLILMFYILPYCLKSQSNSIL